MDRVSFSENQESENYDRLARASIFDPATLKFNLSSAAEDVESLSNVFSWLAHLFFDITRECKHRDGPNQFTIAKIAEMGNYLADSWRDTATRIERNIEGMANEVTVATEADHA